MARQAHRRRRASGRLCPSIVAAVVGTAALDCGRGPDAVPVDAGLDGDAARDVGALDGGGETGDADHEDPADADEGDAGDGGPPSLSGPGPVTLLWDYAEPVVHRICDLDGDGTLDNAFADLGASAEVVIMAIMAAFGDMGGESDPAVLHIPWLEDRMAASDPEVVAIAFRGVDTDADPTDNLSGEEPFWASAYHLDACGEPLYAMHHASVDSGALTASGGDAYLRLGSSFPLRRARVEGTIEPGCLSAEFMLCGAALIQELGGLADLAGIEDVTLLEVFLAGGAAVGVPMVPGLSPDVDLDGDGLERVLLDDDNHVSSCVDGDRTVIEGPDCWRDTRIADAFSLTVRATGFAAVFVGREPGWDERPGFHCDDPPSESLFDRR